jgi:hypothetical protein
VHHQRFAELSMLTLASPVATNLSSSFSVRTVQPFVARLSLHGYLSSSQAVFERLPALITYQLSLLLISWIKVGTPQCSGMVPGMVP